VIGTDVVTCASTATFDTASVGTEQDRHRHRHHAERRGRERLPLLEPSGDVDERTSRR
jgi:hypothetical protein